MQKLLMTSLIALAALALYQDVKAASETKAPEMHVNVTAPEAEEVKKLEAEVKKLEENMKSAGKELEKAGEEAKELEPKAMPEMKEIEPKAMPETPAAGK